MLRKDSKTEQLVYYQVRSIHPSSNTIVCFLNLFKAGIGTYTIPEIATPFWANVSKTVDMMFGSHLDAHIMGKIYSALPGDVTNALNLAGYEFLMQNCWSLSLSLATGITILPDNAGDKICIFGFSRGAYTARALAGM